MFLQCLYSLYQISKKTNPPKPLFVSSHMPYYGNGDYSKEVFLKFKYGVCLVGGRFLLNVLGLHITPCFHQPLPEPRAPHRPLPRSGSPPACSRGG